jgi:hypothetical protein
VDVGDVVDVSEVYAVSMFSVDAYSLVNLCIYIYMQRLDKIMDTLQILYAFLY